MKPQDGVRILHFKAVADTNLAGEFWRVQADSVGLMSYAVYNDVGELLQWYREREVGTGIIMEDYFLSGTDSAGRFAPVKAVIRYDDVVPYQAKPGGIFLFRIQWQGIGKDNMGYELIRNRIFSGDTTVQYAGKTIPAIKFRLRDRVETEKVGILGLDITGEEVYARGQGLIYYRRNISGNRSMTYRLDKVLSPDELQKQYKLELDDPFVKYASSGK
jgi:hypothetical protein